MHMPSPGALVLILLIIVLLFGAKKIPELAKGLGSGIKNFKKAVKEDDEESPKAEESPSIKQAATSESQAPKQENQQKQDA